MDPETFDQLDFISKKGEGIFYPKDIKTLYACKAFLSYLGSSQTNDPEVLQKRQSLILYLQKNPELKAQLFNILGTIEKDTEEAFLNLPEQLTEEEKGAKNNFFLKRSLDNAFGFGSLNNPIVHVFNLSLWIVKLLIPEKISTSFFERYARLCTKNPSVFTASLTVPPIMIFGLSEYFKHFSVTKVIESVYTLALSRSLTPSTSLNVGRVLMSSFIVLPAYFSAKKVIVS